MQISSRLRTTIYALAFALLTLLPALPVWGQGERQLPPAPLSDVLARQFDTTAGSVSFLVMLDDQLDVEASLAAAKLEEADRAARAAHIYAALTAHALTTQADLRAELDAAGVPYRAFYIVNMLEVEGDAALAATLRTHPDVARLEANPTITQAPFLASSQAASNGPIWLQDVIAPWRGETRPTIVEETQETAVDQPWGLSYTGAPQLWAQGVTGSGIVVAGQDTGVQWDHPALQARYRGWDAETETADHVYNWYDVWATSRPSDCAGDPQLPCDDHGHGTHTVGTMLGTGTATQPRIGMAPGATWIGCRNMKNGVGTPASYTACFEFFLAPYPQDGDPMTDGRPELAPHIINNSWGCPPSEGCDADSLRQVVETMRAAGQFVVASAGNYGSSCESVRSPIAIYDATFSIGAHDSTGSIAYFSSRGPVKIDGSGRTKPDLAAPGVSVYSAWVNDGYRYTQGTSMASPHVAGAAALLWSAVPELVGDIDQTEQALIKSATSINATVCDPQGAPGAPNNLFGYGRLNIARAVEMARLSAQLELTASAAEGSPLSDALVIVVDTLTGARYTATTDASGTATIESLYAGQYELSVEGAGGIVPPAPVEILMGESRGPLANNDGAGPSVTYTVVVPSIMEELVPASYAPIIIRSE